MPELDSLHGKIVLSNVLSIFLLTVYLVVAYNSSALPGPLCSILGYSGYFLTLAMFTWMTIMSFDLCRAFFSAQVSRNDK